MKEKRSERHYGHTRLDKEYAAYMVLQRVASELDINVDMRRLMQYSAYMQGVRAAVLRMAEEFPQIGRGKDGVYNRAVVRLAASSIRNADIFVNKTYTRIVIDNHKCDRKGKLIDCEAHFARSRTVDEIM